MFKKLCVVIQKVRTWGLPGVLNYVKDIAFRHRIKTFLLSDARKHPYPHPEHGITLIGGFTQGASHGKVVRDFAHALKNAGIPFQTFNIDPHPNVPQDDVADILTPQDQFHILRYDHVVEILPTIIPVSLGITVSRIAFWEFESGFDFAYPDMALYSRVIAMSDFNATYFRRILPATTRVDKILYPFHAISASSANPNDIRMKYGIAPDDFFVFFNFDFGSSYYRKNPEGALRAFAMAFKDTPRTRLVFKTMRAKAQPTLLQHIQTLAKELGIGNRLTMINNYIPEQDIFDLTNACDVYLSLHRGEGFGITLAEAMAMGKPVVCTNWSSTTEFCKNGATLPVSCKMVSVPPECIDHPYYTKVDQWAEPDVDEAATLLRRLYDNPSLREEIGRKAVDSIHEQFSIENFRASTKAFLET